MEIKIAEAHILDSNGTYLINGSVLPVYLDEESESYLVEEYEEGESSFHRIKDLLADGVLIAIKPISRGVSNE